MRMPDGRAISLPGLYFKETPTWGNWDIGVCGNDVCTGIALAKELAPLVPEAKHRSGWALHLLSTVLPKVIKGQGGVSVKDACG